MTDEDFDYMYYLLGVQNMPGSVLSKQQVGLIANLVRIRINQLVGKWRDARYKENHGEP